MAANATPGTNVYKNYTGPNKFGAPPNNSNRQALSVDNALLTQDFTGRALATPDATQDLTSPLTLSATVPTTVVVPPNATKVTIIGAVAVQVSEYYNGSGALVQYALIPANTPVTLEVARQQYLYLQGGSAGACSFFFQTL